MISILKTYFKPNYYKQGETDSGNDIAFIKSSFKLMFLDDIFLWVFTYNTTGSHRENSNMPEQTASFQGSLTSMEVCALNNENFLSDTWKCINSFSYVSLAQQQCAVCAYLAVVF